MTIQEKAWAGTERSLEAAVAAGEMIAQRMAAGQVAEELEDDSSPYLLEVVDGVATVSIKGPLNNDSGFWNRMFGMTGYPDIREAVIAAAENPDVRHILLDIDSGGGSVSGVEDTAKLIRTINDRVKPVTAYTDGMMCSAAYWLGSAAGEVYSGKAAVVGSIGVIATHIEKSEALKEAGLGVTVVRAGKYKALANSVEKLTDAGRDQLQNVIDAAYQVFVESVAEHRGKSYPYTDEQMAQGREFVGQPAVDAGLIDGLTSYDALLSRIKDKSIDASKNFMDNRAKPGGVFSGATTSKLNGDSEMGKRALTEQDIAALAAGAVVEASCEAEAQAVAGAEAAEIKAGASVDTEADASTEAKPDADKEAATLDASQNHDKSDATIQLLTSQLQAKDEALIQAHVRIAKLEEYKADADATQAALLGIAVKSLSNMQVALGGSAMRMEGASASQVLAEYQNVSAQFQNKFKAGGVSAVSAETPAEKNNDPLYLARVSAVR